MKRTFISVRILLLVLICSLLCSCHTATTSNNEGTEAYTYNFDSYNSFYTVFADPNSAESTQISAEKSLYSKEYSDFIDLMMTDGTMVVPMLNGAVIELRNMDNYAQISLFTQELYNLPWIWYHCQYSGDTNLSISITDLSIVENLNVGETHKFSDVVRKLAPDAPNVDNYENFSGYKIISETEIQLYDRQVSALYYELNNDDRIMVAFVYDDMYVLLRGLPTTLTEDFFEMFSVGKY